MSCSKSWAMRKKLMEGTKGERIVGKRRRRRRRRRREDESR